MRLLWMCALCACAAPANEALPAGPPRSPRSCQDADLVATMKNEAAIANQQKVTDALATYLETRGLTADPAPLEPLREPPPIQGDHAIVSQPTYGVFAHEGSVVLVDYPGIGCDQPATAEYHLARNDAGTEVLIRLAYVREKGAHVEQCGECYVGCGIPENAHPLAWQLPVAADAPLLAEETSVTLDELDAHCEVEKPAM